MITTGRCVTLPSGQKVAALSSLLATVDTLRQAVKINNAVLVEGVGSCGKTTMVNTLAMLFSEGEDDGIEEPCLVTLHLGEHTDAKTLVGAYQCTGVPGEFEWKPGILTRAVLEGWWLLLEDLDQATADIGNVNVPATETAKSKQQQNSFPYNNWFDSECKHLKLIVNISLLLPLVKHGHLLLPGHAQPLTATKTFKLICTKRSSGMVLYKTNLLEVFEDHLFVLHLNPIPDDDVKQMISVLHPDLSVVADKLVDMFHSINADVRSCMKLCGRLVAYITNGRTTLREEVLLECVDCLLGSRQQDDARVKSCHIINEHLTNLSKEKVDYLNTLYKPRVQIILGSTVSIGRAFMPSSASSSMEKLQFAHTRQSLLLLESVGCCVQQQEPVLLVGETGVGKTALVSYLASITGHKLTVVNMSQQSDSTDLLGGFKPVEMATLVFPVKERFEGLFRKTFSTKKNQDFLIHLQEVYAKHHWKTFFKIVIQSAKSGLKRCQKQSMAHMITAWEGLLKDARKMQRQLMKNATVVFSFIEGALVEALHNGWWILLDEVNLATAETLQCLSSLLENQHGSFLLPERGDYQPIARHEDFRLFACMNPATDVGKKTLPSSIRNRFTELFVNELSSNDDLRKLILSYLLTNVQVSEDIIQGIIKFYKGAKEMAENKLSDGTGKKPHFSMRTLCRSLQYVARNPCANVHRSLYEGLCIGFQCQLRKDQHHFIVQLIRTTLPILSTAVIQAPIPKPKGEQCVQVEGFWLPVGSKTVERSDQYVLTTSVRSNLKDIARIVTARNHPVLLQGPTSAGKTSLIQWLAKATGHECLRINNHEHTDLQEYVGMYTANSQGQLVFQEGLLVEAMRKGSWIILDELNLAPTDVLEALNRVLDDNRELFIPETRQLVKANPHFMLFGAQNPPGLYGGRKVLSRAFRNRFVELHFDDIPAEELVTILYRRCKLPESYAKKLVAVMKELQQRRSDSVLFAGKYGLITLRDLFRWAERYRRSPNPGTPYDWEQQLADDGYLLLAGKVRTSTEEDVIRTTIERHFKRQISPSSLFGNEEQSSQTTSSILTGLSHSVQSEQFSHLVWTDDLKRLAVLLGRAIEFDEPILLVGETGCGKTTLCQLFASILGRKLYSINCHMHTEAADFLGGLRPARRRQVNDDNDDDDNEESETKLFEWSDGILVHAMQDGSCLLIDEISLADDAVLERLNSVLEPERTLLVAEKGCSTDNQPYLITAQQGFVLMATMNPGGDYGKKELSPALRNRFTEIWCPSNISEDDYQKIACHNLLPCFTVQAINWTSMMVEFLHWYQQRRFTHRSCVSVRDLLSWATFMNTVSTRLTQPASYYHGARLVFVDSLMSEDGDLRQLTRDRDACVQYLENQLTAKGLYDSVDIDISSNEVELTCNQMFGIKPFYIPIGVNEVTFPEKYSLSATGPKCNAVRLLRAMQLPKPILLEGTPGVGKTSLVMALGQACGHNVVRINLSEQTDISDLFGADLPVESRKKIIFKWRDGPFLKALKNGDWILLDEMNLASQSVLEGLNACLDHRGEIYIPELDMTFLVKTNTRLFACQNPQYQGSGRKGLPRSFLNRFSRVYVEPLSKEDLLYIISCMYPMFNNEMIELMVTFNQLVADLVVKESFDLWEFNIRDVLRWCELIIKHQVPNQWDPGQFIDMIYTRRLRNYSKKKEIESLFVDLFGAHPYKPGRYFHITDDYLQVGRAVIKREKRPAPVNSQLSLLHSQLPLLELLMYCVDMGHMSILVGGNSAGKVSTVQCLAQLTGHKLVEFPMNSETDTTELLGGFEQMNYSRDLVNLREELKETVMCLLCRGEIENQENLLKLKTTVTDLEELSLSRVLMDDEESLITQCSRLQDMVDDLTQLQNLKSDIKVFKKKLRKLTEKIRSDDYSGQFHWVDSVLVKALREGHWLLISNANFCSASVLDRLNAVLEPGGVLILDEKGADGDTIPSIRPHPSFRLFLTMNSKYGEISRAMRNRGIELFILPEEQLDNKDTDLAVLLYQNGIKDVPTAIQLIELHKQVVQLKRNQAHRPPSIPQLLQAARLYQSSEKVSTSLYDCARLSYCLNDITVPVLSQDRDSVFTYKDAGVWCVTNLIDDPRAAVVAASCAPLAVSVKHCNEEHLPFIRVQMKVLLKTAFTDDYRARVKVLDNIVADCSSFDLHTMTQSVKASSKIVMSSDLMKELQQQICELPVEHKLSLSIDLDPLTMYHVKKRLDIIEKIMSLLSLGRYGELLVTFRNHIREGNAKQSGLSLLQLSSAAYRGKLSTDSLPDVNLFYIFPFLKQLFDNLSVYIKKQSASEVLKIFNSLYWLEILQEFCCRPVGRDYSNGLFATVWSIWHDNSLEHLITPIVNWSLSSSTDLADAFKNLEVFSDMFSAGRLLSNIRTKLGHPAVYACEDTADVMVKLSETARHFGIGSDGVLPRHVDQSELSRRSKLLDHYQAVWLCNHHQQTLSKEMKEAVWEFTASVLPVTSCCSEETGLLLQPVIHYSMMNILTTLFEALNSNNVSLLSSASSNISEYLQHLLLFPSIDCTQLLPLSVLLHFVHNINNHSSEPSAVLLATKELVFPLIYSYSCNLQDIYNISSDNSGLCQYRSVITEYCLNTLCHKLGSHDKPLTTDDQRTTLSNRQQHCEELQQLLNCLWSYSCTPLTDPDHLHEKLLRMLQQEFIYIVGQLVSVCRDIDQASISGIEQKLLLHLSVDNISTEDVHVITSVLKSQTKDPTTVELLTDVENSLSKCLALFRECSNMINKVDQDNTSDMQYMLACEKLKTYLSIVEVLLYDPVSPVDYVMYHTVKHNCIQHVIDKEKYLLLAFDWHYRAMTGSGIFDHYNPNMIDISEISSDYLLSVQSTSSETYSLPVQEIIRNISELELKQKSNCQVKSVFRSSSYKYSTLVQLCKDVIAKICSVSNIETLISSTDLATDKVVIWRNSVTSAVKKLLTEYPVYPDVVLPFTASMMQLVDGVTAIVWLQQQLGIKQYDVLSTIGNLLEPPVRMFSKLQLNDNIEMQGERLTAEFMHYILKSCQEHLVETSTLTQNWRGIIMNTLLYFTNAWKLSEEAARQKSESEASLYRYKSHTHVIEDASDETDIINEMFPDYEAEFSKFDDNSEPMDCDDQTKTNEPSAASMDKSISSDTMVEVCMVYLLSSNVSTDHVPMMKCSQCRPTSFLGYFLAGSLAKQLTSLPGMRIDQEGMGSHILTCYNIIDGMKCKEHNESTNYNIYTDSNITEVTKCCPILDALILSVNSLLEQWPDHPILNQIKESVIRVQSLSVDVPVMKVLTGLEYILKKAQDWEAYASSKVSLAVHLTEITNLVIEWRKKELNQWSNLMTSCKLDVQKATSRWWFHLYHLIQEYCLQKDEMSFTNFCQAIQQFMECSSLGEYSCRLIMIEGFASSESVIDIPSQLQAMLWNTHHFYQQFMPTVDQAIERLSLPIVKEFKEYLSIARWNDGTYWALKAKTDKGKRVLAKLTTKFKEVLVQPASVVITDSSLTSETQSLEKTEISKLQQFYDVFISDASSKPPVSVSEAGSFLVSFSNDSGMTTQSSSAFISRLQVLVRESLSSKHFIEIILSVDEFTGTIINTVKELSETAYIHNLPKEKQAAAAKSNILQKQKALSDLFKSLKTLGLSYRKGLQSLSHLQEMYFSLPVVRCDILNDETFAILMESNSYYFKCTARYRAFLNISSPSKKLTLGQVSRCKGLAADILHQVTKQRFRLANVLRDYECLRYIENTLKSLSVKEENGQQEFCFSTEAYNEWLERLCQCLEEVLAAIKHCQRLLGAVPSNSDIAPTPLPFTKLPFFLGANRQEICKTCLEKLKDIMDEVKALVLETGKKIKHINYSKMTFNTIATSPDCQYLVDGYAKLNRVINCLSTIKDELLGSDHSHVGAFQFIPQVTNIVNGEIHSFQQWHTSMMAQVDGLHSEELNESIKSSFNTVLLASQHIVKQYSILQSATMTSDEDCDYIEHWGKAYATVMIVANSSDTQQVCSSIGEVMDTLHNTFSKSKIDLSTLQLIHQLQVSVKEFNKLVHKLLVDLLATHRTMCKLSSVLFAVFATVFSKGFCAEELNVSDEVEGEGATEFVDAEGGGFDEGAGATNVSKDCQDLQEQLENATQKEPLSEEQKENNINDDNDDDGVEMSEDFEGTVTNLPERDEEEDSSDDEGEDDSEDITDKLGELGENEHKGLDKNMWAPEDEDDKELSECQENVDGGVEVKGSDEIVAKDDSLKKQNNSKDDAVPDVNGEEEFEEQNTDDYKLTDPLLDELVNPQDIQDIPETDFHLDDGDKEDIDDNDDVEGIDGTGFDKEDDSSNAEDAEETEETVQDKDLAADGNEESNDKENSDEVQSDWQPDLTTMPTGDNQQATDDCTTSNAPSTEAQQSNEVNSMEQDVDSQELCGNTESTAMSHDTMDTSDNVQLESQRKSSDRRTLADDDHRPVKKPRIVDDEVDNKDEADSSEMQKEDDAAYKHIEEDQGSASVWDAATKEQLQDQKQQQPRELEDNSMEPSVTKKDDRSYVKNEITNTATKSSNSSKADSVPTPEDSETSDVEKEEESSKHDDPVNMDIVESYYCTDASLISIHRVDPTKEDLLMIRQQIEEATKFLHSTEKFVDTTELWLKYESLTVELAQMLYERIRLTFQPTQASQLKGDYKTGKRLNMRRIIPYIASHYQNDRIWLRRSKPSKMHYQLLIAIDDSSSMQDNECKQTAYESLAVISGALCRLDGAQLGICRFGSEVDVLHKFTQNFTTLSGAFILEQMSFQQPKTNFVKLLEVSRALFVDNAQHSVTNMTSSELHQLLVILSDGRGVFAEGTLSIQIAVRKLQELGVFVVFIILDPLHKDSILDIRVPIFSHTQSIQFKSYLDMFPFPFYLVLKEIKSMPAVLGDALQQWFQLINDGHFVTV